MRRRRDEPQYEPHPGDPWHPTWVDTDDLFVDLTDEEIAEQQAELDAAMARVDDLVVDLTSERSSRSAERTEVESRRMQRATELQRSGVASAAVATWVRTKSEERSRAFADTAADEWLGLARAVEIERLRLAEDASGRMVGELAGWEGFRLAALSTFESDRLEQQLEAEKSREAASRLAVWAAGRAERSFTRASLAETREADRLASHLRAAATTHAGALVGPAEHRVTDDAAELARLDSQLERSRAYVANGTALEHVARLTSAQNAGAEAEGTGERDRRVRQIELAGADEAAASTRALAESEARRRADAVHVAALEEEARLAGAIDRGRGEEAAVTARRLASELAADDAERTMRRLRLEIDRADAEVAEVAADASDRDRATRIGVELSSAVNRAHVSHAEAAERELRSVLALVAGITARTALAEAGAAGAADTGGGASAPAESSPQAREMPESGQGWWARMTSRFRRVGAEAHGDIAHGPPPEQPSEEMLDRDTPEPLEADAADPSAESDRSEERADSTQIEEVGADETVGEWLDDGFLDDAVEGDASGSDGLEPVEHPMPEESAVVGAGDMTSVDISSPVGDEKTQDEEAAFGVVDEVETVDELEDEHQDEQGDEEEVEVEPRAGDDPEDTEEDETSPLELQTPVADASGDEHPASPDLDDADGTEADDSDGQPIDAVEDFDEFALEAYAGFPATADQGSEGAEPTSGEGDVDRAAETAAVAEGEAPDDDGGIDAEMETWSDPAWGVEAPDEDAGQIEFEWQGEEIDTIPDFAAYTPTEYMKTTTQEYAGLAAEVARAAGEIHEMSPVAAGIPGIESGMLDLDDMMSAAGDSGDSAVEERNTDLPLRVMTGLGLIILFGLSLAYRWSVAVLIGAIILLAAGEFFASLVRGRYRPLTLVGLAGVAAALAGTWIWGVASLPVVLLLVMMTVILFYAIVPRPAPLVNTVVTLMVVVWVGGLGSFAMEIVDAPDYRWLVGAFVVTVGMMDVAQYVFGRRLGKRPLAPVVSPKKTLEGLIAGVVIAIAVGAAWGLAPPLDVTTGIGLGVAVAVVAPFGDLAISVVKRALGIKDMGTILPGHGGALDRIDAMIVALPAAWIVFSWAGVL